MKMKKYLIWLVEYPQKYKFFDNKIQAIKICQKQKSEAYVNENVGKYNEDTIYGNGVK